MSDYDNPFAEIQHTGGGGSPSTPSRAQAPPPVYGVGGGSDQLRAKELELQRREQELEKREHALAARERAIPNYDRPLNWPAWPKPLYHHDIAGEIPADLRGIVRRAYVTWYLSAFLILWNFICVTGALVTESKIGDFVLGIVYLFIWTGMTLRIYRLFYNAARKGSASRYFFFFFMLGFQIAVHCLWVVGLKGSGMGGFILMLSMFSAGSKSDKVVGLMMLVNCVLWVISVITLVYLWIHARLHYNKFGGDAAAKRELAAGATQYAAENPETASKLATTAARAAV